MTALQQCAQRQETSVHDIVLRAVDEYLDAAHQASVHRTAQEQAAKWRQLMDRLK
ncbi:CopG family transcriptional regulator [Streptomyces olivoreticuli]|uniref:CopG family transcriptional regulator n=1 Tax=Streptomyces olivoreticuli TaxID=68246 RepID=UPI000E2297C6|nr:CopG family transcriptional regulator [Streptomyces olivoreticuli]